MSRPIKSKQFAGTSLASNYGGWIYCGGCNQTIGYLCYATYDDFSLSYTCKCGNCGSMSISMADGAEGLSSDEPMPIRKNRCCCPGDDSPLITIRDVNLISYQCRISCHNCNKIYSRSHDGR